MPVFLPFLLPQVLHKCQCRDKKFLEQYQQKRRKCKTQRKHYFKRATCSGGFYMIPLLNVILTGQKNNFFVLFCFLLALVWSTFGLKCFFLRALSVQSSVLNLQTWSPRWSCYYFIYLTTLYATTENVRIKYCKY